MASVKVTKCKMCGKMFEHERWQDRKYCSRTCHIRYRNLTDNPAKKLEVRKKFSEIMKRQIKEGKRKAFGHGYNPSFSNELNGRWLGGKKNALQRIRGTKKYRDFRLKILERDNYTCQKCGKVNGNLHLDHLKDFKKYPELIFVEDNVRTLCASCHANKTLRGIE